MANTTRIAASRHLPRLSTHDPCFATVLVGPERKRFVVHKDLLTYHSDFFKAALTGSFKEAEEQTIPLLEDCLMTFELFVHCMYHKDFPTTDNANAELLQEWAGESGRGQLEMENLIRLHVFADRYRVEKLKLLTLDALFVHMQKRHVSLASRRLICYAYNNLPASSRLLSLLVDIRCRYMRSDGWRDEDPVQLPSLFLVSILKRLTDGVRGKVNVGAALRLCDYHAHDSVDQKEACLSKNSTR